MIILFSVVSLLIWLAILALPWQAWRTRESFDVEDRLQDNVANKRQDVTILIPARNEAAQIKRTLESLAQQSRIKKIILIDDQSDDNTSDIARSLHLKSLDVITGTPLPEGWSGKLWALQQGFSHVDSEWVLLLDADITLKDDCVSALRDKAEHEQLDFISLMANLSMRSFWEKLLIPSFIYFFKQLYPFHLSNKGNSHVAAAAGGCILVKKSALDATGGFISLRDALIDDCTLAKSMRNQNMKTWIGLSNSAVSHRRYTELQEIWDMVARTAYSQLRYSPSILLLCSALMIIAYIYPVFLILSGHFSGWVIITLMLISFMPTIKYYKLHPIWLLGLPASGVLYLLMTWSSAIRFYRGQRSQWKGRIYTSKS